LKHGGDLRRVDLEDAEPEIASPCNDLLDLNEALEKLEKKDRRKADFVKLRFFAGLTIPQAAEVLGISVSTADADWDYARCWMRLAMSEKSSTGES
jgi:DNA-directed RNA polymerase specialized sigma24 family protein